MLNQPDKLKTAIETAWNRRAELGPATAGSKLRGQIDACLQGLESGELRVAEPGAHGWVVNQWLKQAILLHFRMTPNRVMDGTVSHYYDKVDLRFADESDRPEASGARIVPTATVAAAHTSATTSC